MKIKDFYGLGANTYLNVFGNSREFITGCEYEIEDIHSLYEVESNPKIKIVEDHSLRNNGREFTTRPLRFDDQVELFKFLHANLKLGIQPFSDRTSIHVHVNVRELTMVEVRQLVLLYALLEPLFFNYVGEVRQGSIFCVPLNWTYLPGLYKLPINELRNKWHKYTAFNIVPINSFGTVEFRHMYGTGNVQTFTFWLECLKELYTFIESTTDFDIIKEISSEGFTIKGLSKKVVPSLSNAPDDVYSLLEDTLLDVKLSTGGLK